MSHFLEIAKQAAYASAEVSLRYYEKNIVVETKPDKTPVTVADRESEAAAIKIIKAEYPEHGILGEESGHSRGQSDYLWIIDPIDGTKNFIAGIPLWGTLIALMSRNEVIIGVSYIPLLKEILYAEKGHGAFLNDRAVHVSSTPSLKQSMVSFGSMRPFREKGYGKGIDELINQTQRQRSFGDLYPYHLLAAGKLEIVVEAAIKIVDVAPFAVIIPEAGGRISDLYGRGLALSTDSFIATNSHVHEDALGLFLKA